MMTFFVTIVISLIHFSNVYALPKCDAINVKAFSQAANKCKANPHPAHSELPCALCVPAIQTVNPQCKPNVPYLPEAEYSQPIVAPIFVDDFDVCGTPGTQCPYQIKCSSVMPYLTSNGVDPGVVTMGKQDEDEVKGYKTEDVVNFRNGNYMMRYGGTKYDFIVLDTEPYKIRFASTVVGHTSMMSGIEYSDCQRRKLKVKFAGTMKIGATDGKVQYWTNDSGHFLPDVNYAGIFAGFWGLPTKKFKGRTKKEFFAARKKEGKHKTKELDRMDSIMVLRNKINNHETGTAKLPDDVYKKLKGQWIAKTSQQKKIVDATQRTAKIKAIQEKLLTKRFDQGDTEPKLKAELEKLVSKEKEMQASGHNRKKTKQKKSMLIDINPARKKKKNNFAIPNAPMMGSLTEDKAHKMYQNEYDNYDDYESDGQAEKQSVPVYNSSYLISMILILLLVVFLCSIVCFSIGCLAGYTVYYFTTKQKYSIQQMLPV